MDLAQKMIEGNTRSTLEFVNRMFHERFAMLLSCKDEMRTDGGKMFHAGMVDKGAADIQLVERLIRAI